VPAGWTLAGNALQVPGDGLPPTADRVAALPTAAALLRLAPSGLAGPAAHPAAQALPLYIRDKVAQTTEERAADRARKESRPAPEPT
jgi:tRNA threonylcarbamoyladenosine biosynthesis protein TsaB